MTSTSGPRRRTAIVPLLAAPLLLAACTPADVVSPPGAAAAELAEFGSCDELLTYFQEHALERVGPWGFGAGGWFTDDTMSMEDSTEGGAEGAAAAASDGGQDAAGTDFSGTNNQEEGVEEPDLWQTDGDIVVTVSNGSLVVVDVASRSRLGSVRLPGESWGSELLLDRERGQALVLSQDPSGTPRPAATAEGLSTYPAFGSSRTVVTLVDLSDPGNPTTTGSIRLEGDYRSARMHDGTARVVLVTPPQGLAFVQPRSGSMAAEQEAEDANRRIVEESTLDDWLPHRQTSGGDTSGTELAVPCEQISRPPEFSGLATMSVLTFDLDGGIEPTSSTGVVASGSTVYASTDRLVVATSPWEAWAFSGGEVMWDDDRDLSTALHTFDLTAEDSTDYLASGSVEGRMLSQFSLDESDGIIRVATTTDSSGSTPSSSSLVVLAEEGDRLVEQGRVDGLGETEQIYAVRYLDADTAAVVTFRQTDPLYLVDTSDPSAPEVSGELKIPGYSAYLHPLGEGLLLGVGQDATDQGVTTGLAVSLFDISDPSAPTQVAKQTWEDHYSEVEHEHRAFTYWPQTGQLFLPANAWDEEQGKEWVGVVSASVEGQALSQGPAAQLGGSGQAAWDYPRRTAVIGDSVWILGEQSVRVADLATLEQQAVLDLPGAGRP